MESSAAAAATAAAEFSFSFGSRRIQGQEAGGFHGVGACDDMAWVVEKGNVFGLGDDFVVDDLLDFGQLETTQTEGEDDDDDDNIKEEEEEEHQNRNKKHHHQIQQQQQHSLGEDNSAVSFEPIPTPVSELTLPAHDAAELEWVSRIMDESLSEFQTYSAPKPYFPPPQHMHMPMPMPMPMVTIPVKAKRSKRARTLSWSSSCCSSSSSWGSGVPLLFIDSSSSTTTTTTTSSSSSCSSSSSSYYSSSSSKQKQQQQLIFGHQVFDEIPVSVFPPPNYDDSSKSNSSCVILKKQKANKAKKGKKGKGKKRGRKPKSSSSVVVVVVAGEGAGGGGGRGGGERQCSHCGVNKTPQWRTGPEGAKTLCNACGVRYKSGRLLPEYRPACSPSFLTHVHSNSHRKVLEMRRNKGEDDELQHSNTHHKQQLLLPFLHLPAPIAY